MIKPKAIIKQDCYAYSYNLSKGLLIVIMEIEDVNIHCLILKNKPVNETFSLDKLLIMQEKEKIEFVEHLPDDVFQELEKIYLTNKESKVK